MGDFWRERKSRATIHAGGSLFQRERGSGGRGKGGFVFSAGGGSGECGRGLQFGFLLLLRDRGKGGFWGGGTEVSRCGVCW